MEMTSGWWQQLRSCLFVIKNTTSSRVTLCDNYKQLHPYVFVPAAILLLLLLFFPTQKVSGLLSNFSFPLDYCLCLLLPCIIFCHISVVSCQGAGHRVTKQPAIKQSHGRMKAEQRKLTHPTPYFIVQVSPYSEKSPSFLSEFFWCSQLQLD